MNANKNLLTACEQIFYADCKIKLNTVPIQ